MPRKYWIAAGAAVALVGLWLYSRRAQNPTAAPTIAASRPGRYHSDH